MTSWPLTATPQAHTLSVITNEEWSLHYRGEGGEHDLFYLPSDPKQKKNLIRSQRAVAEKMVADYVEFLKQIDCPEEKLAHRTRL